MAGFWGLALVVVLLLVGCTDAAEGPFHRGQDAEKVNNLEGAEGHYKKAIAAAPDTEFGGKAKEALAALKPRLKQRQKEREAAKKAREAADADKAQKPEAAACKSGKWTFFCEGGGGLLTKDSKAECQEDRNGFVNGFHVKCAPCKCADGVPGAL